MQENKGLPTIADLQAKTGVNPKQALFVLEFMKDSNQKQAAIRAGYKAKHAESVSSRMSRNARVQAAIAIARESLSSKVGIEAVEVLQQWKRFGWIDLAKLHNEDGSLKAIHEIDPDSRQAIASVETAIVDGKTVITKYKLVDKRAVVADVARHLGMLDGEKTASEGPCVKVYIGVSPDDI